MSNAADENEVDKKGRIKGKVQWMLKTVIRKSGIQIERKTKQSANLKYMENDQAIGK